MTSLSKNKDIVIQKSDKGNFAATVDKETYIKRLENLLSDRRKFERVTLKNHAFLNFVMNQEKRIDTIFKNLNLKVCQKALQSPTYTLAKLLVPILNPLTKDG